MPIAMYWDETTQLFKPLGPLGPDGSQGATGPTGPAGPTGTVTEDVQFVPLDGNSVYVGSAPPAGTRYKLYCSTWVVTAGVFADAYCPLTGIFSYGWSAMAMMGDGSPFAEMGLTIYPNTSKLDTLGSLVWSYAGRALVQNTAVRINAFVIGA